MPEGWRQRTFDAVSRIKTERVAAAVDAMHAHAEGGAQCSHPASAGPPNRIAPTSDHFSFIACCCHPTRLGNLYPMHGWHRSLRESKEMQDWSVCRKGGALMTIVTDVGRRVRLCVHARTHTLTRTSTQSAHPPSLCRTPIAFNQKIPFITYFSPVQQACAPQPRRPPPQKKAPVAPSAPRYANRAIS